MARDDDAIVDELLGLTRAAPAPAPAARGADTDAVVDDILGLTRAAPAPRGADTDAVVDEILGLAPSRGGAVADPTTVAAAPAPPADNRGTGQVVLDAFQRGARGMASGAVGLVDAEAAAKMDEENAAANPRKYPDLETAFKTGDVGGGLAGVGESIVESAAATGAILGVGAATVASGGGLLAAGAAAGGASAALTTGNIRAEQFANTGKTSDVAAVTGGVLSGALDAIPGSVVLKPFLKTAAKSAVEFTATHMLRSALKGAGKVAPVDAVTEGVQEIIESIATDPARAEMLFNPKTDADRRQRDRMLWQAANAAAAGGGIGSVSGAGGGVLAERKGRKDAAGKAAVARAAAPPPADAADGYIARMNLIEASGRKADAKENPESGAKGPFQFTDKTWVDYMRRERPDITKGKSNAAVIALHKDQNLQNQMMQAFTEDNAKELERNSLPVQNGTLGVMHRFGMSGGIKVLKAAQANPDTPISSVVSALVMKQNPDLRTEKLDTVGEVAEFYERLLGMGMTFNRAGKAGAGISVIDVRTADDKTGVEFGSLSVADAASVATDMLNDALDAELNRELDTRASAPKKAADPDADPEPEATRDAIPKATKVKLARALELSPEGVESNNTGQRVLARLMEISDGTTAIRLDTVEAAQVQQAATVVLERLGYGRVERAPGDYTAAQSAPDFRAPAGEKAAATNDTPRWRVANSLRQAFTLLDSGDNLGRITTDSGGRVLAQGLRALADTQAKLATAASQRAKNTQSAARRTSTKASQVAAKLQTLFTRGAAAIEYLSETPTARTKNTAFPDPAAARTAVLDMVSGTAAVPQARVAARLLADFTPGMTRERSGPRGKGYYTFFKQLEKFATDAGATDATTREAVRIMFKTSDERAGTLKAALKSQAALRAEVVTAERAERNEARAREVEAWHTSMKNVADSQALNGMGRLRASAPMLIDLLMGNTEKMAGYAAKERSPWLLYKALKATRALVPGMDTMSLNFLDKFLYRKVLQSATLNRVRSSFIDHTLRITTAMQGVTRAHVADAERVTTLLTDSVAKNNPDNPRSYDPDYSPQEAMRRLTAIMHRATSYRLAAAHVDKNGNYQSLSVFLDDMRNGLYDEARQAQDPNGRHARADEEGNWSYSDYAGPLIESLSASLDALADENGVNAQANAYVKTRQMILDSLNKLLLYVVNNRRRELGLSVVQTLTDVDKLSYATAEVFEGDPSLTAATRESLNALVQGRLEGDYFPLQRVGNYSLFARQFFTVSAAAAVDAERMARERQSQSPFFQFKDRAATPTAVRNEATGLYDVQLEIAFYAQFDTKKEAEQAYAELLDQQNAGTPTDTVATQRDLMPEFFPTELGTVQEVGSPIDRSNSGGLSEAQSAALLGAAKDDVELKNILIDLLPDRRMVAALKTRKDVLGGPPMITEILRVREPAVAAALGRVSGAQDLREVFAKMREYRERTLARAAAATTTKERRELQDSADNQRLLTDYLEKRLTEKIEPWAWLAPMNNFLSRAATAWFLFGVSHSIMNLTQLYGYGLPIFTGRYGPLAGPRLMVQYTKSLGSTIRAFARGRMRDGNTRAGMDYFVDGREIDARHFADGERINTLDELKKLSWSEIAGRPKEGGTFAVNSAGASSVFLVSESEFVGLQRGEYTMAEFIALSNARKGGHLSAVFVEEARIKKLRAMSAAESVGAAARGTANRLFDVGSFAPSIIEYANRHAVVLAALHEETRKFREQGLQGDLPDALFQEVERAASELNDFTNANYNTANRSVLQRKMGVLMIFTTLPISITMHMWHLTTSMAFPTAGEGGYSRKQAAAVTAMLFATIGSLAGANGAIPIFHQMLATGGLNLLSWMFDDGNDEDDDSFLDRVDNFGASHAVAAAIREQSQFLGDMWSRGPVSMATGADLQGRLGIHQAPLRINTGFAEGKEALGAAMFSFLGPVGSVGASAFEFVVSWADTGELDTRALQNMIPKQIRDVWRGVNFVAGKGYTDASGNVLISGNELDAGWEAFIQLIGFTPNKVADLNKVRFAQAKRDKELRAESKRASKNAKGGDFDDVNQFNEQNPGRAIKPSSIVRGMIDDERNEAIRTTVTDGLNPDRIEESMELSRMMGLRRSNTELDDQLAALLADDPDEEP